MILLLWKRVRSPWTRAIVQAVSEGPHLHHNRNEDLGEYLASLLLYLLASVPLRPSEAKWHQVIPRCSLVFSGSDRGERSTVRARLMWSFSWMILIQVHTFPWGLIHMNRKKTTSIGNTHISMWLSYGCSVSNWRNYPIRNRRNTAQISILMEHLEPFTLSQSKEVTRTDFLVQNIKATNVQPPKATTRKVINNRAYVD